MRSASLEEELPRPPTRADCSGCRLAGLKNGNLLRRIVGKFDVLITTDKSIQFQQNLPAWNIGFVLLRARSNDIVDIEPLVPKLMARFDEIAPGKLLIIE